MELLTAELIKSLVEELNTYRDAYYNKSESLISDSKYDKLFDKLKKLEEETGIVYANSPTQTVGYEVKSELQKVKHSHPMLSLDKTKSVNELIEFINNEDFVLSCKLDGLTVLLTYENGQLLRAETRGNGEVGEDITHNSKVFENIPLRIPNKNHFEIKGEAIITYKDFERINAELPYEERYKNPRNLVSGSVRQLDSGIASKRHIKFIAWEVVSDSFDTLVDGFDYAESIGFDVVPYVSTNDTEHIDELIEDRKEFARIMSYPIDGLVCTYSYIWYRNSLGTTSHHPRHSIAYKFYDEDYETTLKNIEWSCGKTGQITPVAIFEPVEIDGTTVERASLSNLSVMYDTLGIPYVGQTIYATKRNQIIPKIERANNKYNTETFDSFGFPLKKFISIPLECPVCGEPTSIISDSKTKVLHLMCTNPNCKGKLLGKLTHFVSKNAMNIDGLSEATLERFINNGWLNSFKDIYKLKNYEYDMRVLTEGMGERSTEKLLYTIESSKVTTLDRLLNAVCIPNIGKSTAKDIAKFCEYDVDKFKSYMCDSPEIFKRIDGVGETVVASLEEWIETEWVEFLELCSCLNIIKPNTDNVSPVNLTGMTFVITGSLSTFTNRDEAREKIESLGGKVAGSVSKNTTYLVNNDINSTSGKNKKAKELGISIITEEELRNIMQL